MPTQDYIDDLLLFVGLLTAPYLSHCLCLITLHLLTGYECLSSDGVAMATDLSSAGFNASERSCRQDQPTCTQRHTYVLHKATMRV